MATVELSATDFESTILGNDMVLVDWWAAWCGPCRQFAPVFERASEQHTDIVFAKIDTEAEQGLAGAAQITSIPTLMAFKDGRLVYREAGALPPAVLEQLIDAVKALDVDEAEAESESSAAADGAERA